MIKKLLSLPPNLVGCFHEITGLSQNEYFCTNDPVGHKLGSGGGTAWLLQQAYLSEECRMKSEESSFKEWISHEKRILLHAGGQSRRLPSYAPSGKILTPLPVFRWERGQRLSQDLLSLQVPLYEQIMDIVPESIHTMVVSGDVYIRATQPLQPVPEADVVCYGLWLGPEIAKDHGVFVSSRQHPQEMKCMLQKPSMETLSGLLNDHFYLTDIGIWLLSDHAVELLMKRAVQNNAQEGNHNSPFSILHPLLREYDLYGEFGLALGTHPTIEDTELAQLKVVVLPLAGGEFYHFGTSRELISSMVTIQNLENDQRKIMHHSRKPHPAIFVQNAVTENSLTAENTNVWIENSYIGRHWHLSHDHIITGVPENDFHLKLNPGQCVDVVPIGDSSWAVRCYHIDDKFSGKDQQEKRFPVVNSVEEIGFILERREERIKEREFSQEKNKLQEDKNVKKESFPFTYLSAEDISNQANMHRLVAQRRDFRKKNWPLLAENWQHSVFYQVDLEDAAREYREMNIPMPSELPVDAPLMTRIHDAMFRDDSTKAFSLLQQGLTQQVLAEKQTPRMSVYSDQIVWGRSPVRIDIAGGWSDTPPYCLMEGGNVVNLAIELNGQPPLHAYVRPCREPHIILRSIDLGAMEQVSTYEELADYHHVGSPFSIPKAALVLAGFQPGFSSERYDTLEHQLQAFGCGIELTLLSAIPAGSGLGTSSVLASTVLGALNDFCGLAWDKNEIGHRTLVLEQLLTTGGGWQDQFGGILQGVKLLQTERGFEQNPTVRWLPNDLFTQPEYQQCHLLYYTGITRTAKKILAEIVRRMFLNQSDELRLLREMKQHAMDMYEAIQRADFRQMGILVRKTWQQNQSIDSGTNPEEVEAITRQIDDFCLGYKLGGAGGGGYLYMVAKDPEAAARIKKTLQQYRPNANARFVEMSLSTQGLQVSRS